MTITPATATATATATTAATRAPAPGTPGPSTPGTPSALRDPARERHILHVHFHLPYPDPELYEELLVLLRDFTPAVQELPPMAAALDLTGALRFFDCDPTELALRLQVQVFALHGVATSVGAAANRMIATMAADLTPPGELTTVDPGTERAFLNPRPVATLPGVGPATARTLTRHGLHTVGALATTPLLTLQRLLGTAVGRQLHERAHGHDPRPVTPHAPPRSTSATHEFARDELDPTAHRRALLALTGELGLRLRTTHQITPTLTLTVRYADRSTTTRTRALPEPTHHTATLTGTAYDLYAFLGLQRARVRTLTLRAEALAPAHTATHQLTFDPADAKARAVEAAADRARLRFGPGAVVPASVCRAGGRAPRRSPGAPAPGVRAVPSGGSFPRAARGTGP
ncbi:DNA polymerase thumb domain-containing protein [Streptomyces sp. NPDC091272]|uniref:DNA polymerase Y family protein n=1 Tax=Streptomyces sp. NPDC091272 TaxID=3365981 RepID=UPI0037F4E21F